MTAASPGSVPRASGAVRVARLAIALAVAGVSFGAQAQAATHAAHGMPAPAAVDGATGVDAHAFHAQMDVDMRSMMQAMDAAPMTGNADIDFAAMMIPHHQGAIDMARLQLQYGTDPAMRRLAQEIIVTQQSEIDLMRRRLQQLQAGVSR